LNPETKSNRGGRREGAGRKKDPLKDLRTGALTAQKLLRELKEEKEIRRIYENLDDAKKLQIIFRLRDSAYGRAPVTEADPAGGTGKQLAVFVLERIGTRTKK